MLPRDEGSSRSSRWWRCWGSRAPRPRTGKSATTAAPGDGIELDLDRLAVAARTCVTTWRRHEDTARARARARLWRRAAAAARCPRSVTTASSAISSTSTRFAEQIPAHEIDTPRHSVAPHGWPAKASMCKAVQTQAFAEDGQAGRADAPALLSFQLQRQSSRWGIRLTAADAVTLLTGRFDHQREHNR